MFPFTIVAICGVGLAKRGAEILLVWEYKKKQKTRGALFLLLSGAEILSRTSSRLSGTSTGSQNSKKSKEIMEDAENADGEMGEGFTTIQKSALGFVWVASAAYACLTDKILAKDEGQDVICSVREDLSEKLNIISALVVIGFPTLCLILWPVGHLLLDLFSCMKGIVMAGRKKSEAPQPNCCGDDSSDSCIETILVFGFSIIFLVVYPTSQIFAELYFADIKTMFPFMLLKCCLGSMHLVMSPACILIIKRDLRKAAKDIYLKRKAASDEGDEMSAEELLERLRAIRGVSLLHTHVYCISNICQ